MRRTLGRHAKPKPRKALPRKNAKRAASEFTRCYGSKARVKAVKAMPCVVPYCGYWRSFGCENAHVPSKSGTSRKGDAKHVVPCCPVHHQHARVNMHNTTVEDFNAFYGCLLYTSDAADE